MSDAHYYVRSGEVWCSLLGGQEYFLIHSPYTVHGSHVVIDEITEENGRFVITGHVKETTVNMINKAIRDFKEDNKSE